MIGRFIPDSIILRRNIRRTKKFFNKFGYEVGDYTFGGKIEIRHNKNAKLKIGKFCMIASDVVIDLGTNRDLRMVTTYPLNYEKKYKFMKDFLTTKGDIIIGNDVWIGRKSTIMSGVKIGDGAVVGANSVVTRDVPAYSIVCGNPARIKKMRFDDKTIKKLLKIKWWNFDPKELIDNVEFMNIMLDL